ncbi:MAG: oligosaccharide flippase family protein [Clostridium sp.]|uniref:oligosaccharide flippase family protein n=1 Tax=Clostridium sp. TaxID=1506 RepID=UPI003F368B93
MEKSISKNIIFKFILNLFNIIVPILIGPYVTRRLGPDMMGAVNYSQAIFGYFFIFASFGVYQYGLREIANVRNDKEKTAKIFTSLFLITLVTNVISTIAYFATVMTIESSQEVYISCIILTFNLISNVFYIEWVNEAEENYDFITIKTIAVKIIYTILLLLMVKSAANLKEYLWLLVLSTFLNNFISFLYVKKHIRFNFKDLKIVKHLKPMVLVVILSNVNVLYTQFDRLILGASVSTLEVGYYGIGQTLSNLVSSLIFTLIYVTIPRLTNYSANENEGKYIELLNKIAKVYFLLIYPACIGMALLSTEVVSIYGGVEFIGAVSVVMMYSIYMITLGYESILTNQIMYVKSKERVIVKIVLIYGIVNVFLKIILLKLGCLNAATAITTTMISNLLIILSENYYVRKKLKVDFRILSIDKFKYGIISLLFIPIILIIKSIFTGIVPIVGVSVAICGGIYFIILYKIKDEMFLYVIEKVFGKIKNKFS